MFKDIATPCAAIGIPVFPLSPGTKVPPSTLDGWQRKATTDLAQIEAWNDENPDYNVALVAKAVEGGFCCLEFDVRGGMARAAEEMGQARPETMLTQSGRGFGHWWFRHTERSIGLGNCQAHLPEKDEDGKLKEWFSFRANDRYLVGPGSIHPNGNAYRARSAMEPISIPDWLCDWIEKHSNNTGRSSTTADRRSPPMMHEDFDIDDFLSHVEVACNVSLLSDYESNGVTYYPLDGCPNNDGAEHSNHTGRKTCVTMGDFGLGFHCFADQCTDFGITALLLKMREDGNPYEGPMWAEACDEISEFDVEDVTEIATEPPASATEFLGALQDLRSPLSASLATASTLIAADQHPANATVVSLSNAEIYGSDEEFEQIKRQKARMGEIWDKAEADKERVNSLMEGILANGDEPAGEANPEAIDEIEPLPPTSPSTDYATLLHEACYADGKLHRIGRQAIESGKPLGWMLPGITTAYTACDIKIRYEDGTWRDHCVHYTALMGGSNDGKTEAAKNSMRMVGDECLRPDQPPVSDNALLMVAANIRGDEEKGTNLRDLQKPKVMVLKEGSTMINKTKMDTNTVLSTCCDLWDDGRHGGKNIKGIKIPPLVGHPFGMLFGLKCENPGEFGLTFPPGSEDGFWGRCLLGLAERPWDFHRPSPVVAKIEVPMVIVPDELGADSLAWQKTLQDKKAAIRMAQILIRVACTWQAAESGGNTLEGHETVDCGVGIDVHPVLWHCPQVVKLTRGVYEAAKKFMMAQYEVRKEYKPGEGRVEDALIAQTVVAAVKKLMLKNGGFPVTVREVFRSMPLRERWGYPKVMWQITGAAQGDNLGYTDPGSKDGRTVKGRMLLGAKNVWLPELLDEHVRELIKKSLTKDGMEEAKAEYQAYKQACKKG